MDGPITPQPRLMPRRRVLRDLGLSAAGGLGIAAALNVDAASADTPVTAINVKDPPYNAKGDGNQDDRLSIQLALNAVPANGGAVYFPPGDYAVSGPLDPHSHTLMYGSHTPRWIGGNNPTASTKIRRKADSRAEAAAVSSRRPPRPSR